MSLFGDDTDAASSSRPKSSLFEDDTSKSKTTAASSMFGDSAADVDDSSPWGFTPSKKSGAGGRGSLVKNLLADADVPDVYVDSFDGLQSGGFVEAGEARAFLGRCAIRGQKEAQVWDIASNRGESTRLGRGEWSVLLALVGLAQEGEELSLDAVDERRRKLPVPHLPEVKEPVQQSAAGAPQQQQQQSASPPQARKPSFGAGFGESDPWGSPNLHKGHAHLNGNTPQRTTSTFTTGAAAENPSGSYTAPSAPANDSSSAWGNANSYGANSTGGGFGNPPSSSGGFEGEEGGGSNNPTTPRRAAPDRTTSKGAEEVVTVNLLDEKEGMFMFQHRNYEVASARRASKVIRRYSDFVWLLDCLHKRYPFRQLPLLPPKRVQINGNHLAADSGFLEKRRRGLARFANALVRHPVLREEQLVVMFLTVPTVDACLPVRTITQAILTDGNRNSLSGANKRPSPCRRNLLGRRCLPGSKTACRRHCRILSIPSALG